MSSSSSVLRSIISLAMMLSLLSTQTMAGQPSEEQMIRNLFGPREHFGSLFAKVLLDQVPEKKLAEIIDQYNNELGSFERASGTSRSYSLIFSRGEAPCRIHLSQAGLIDGLWFGSPSRRQDSLASISAELSQLDGTVSVNLTRNGSDSLFFLNEKKPLAVGSTFKLYVLQAFRQAISGGVLSASQSTPLKKEWMSLPSGILQNWPGGTPITLETLANLMISVSDNTATDHLLFLIGRDEVEKLAPNGNSPFLSTMEMFRLKYLDKSWRDRFLAASERSERLTILEEISSMTLSVEKVGVEPIAIDKIEWFMTTPELCRIIWDLRHDPALSINPGLVEKEKWNLAAYKGGSEAGVLNYTLALQKATGSDTYCLSATINNSANAAPTKAFDRLVARLITLIENGGLPNSLNTAR